MVDCIVQNNAGSLLIPLVDDEDDMDQDPLYPLNKISGECKRLRTGLLIFGERLCIDEKDRVSTVTEGGVEQADALAAWQQSRVSVRKCVVPKSISDVRRRAHKQNLGILKDRGLESRDKKEAIINQAEELGKPLITRFIENTRTWPMCLKHARAVGPRYLDIDRLPGCVHGLPARMVGCVKSAFKKPPVGQTGFTETIKIGTMLDIAAYVSEARVERYKRSKLREIQDDQEADDKRRREKAAEKERKAARKAARKAERKAARKAERKAAHKAERPAEAAGEHTAEVAAEAAGESAALPAVTAPTGLGQKRAIMTPDELDLLPNVPKKRRTGAAPREVPKSAAPPAPQDGFPFLKKGMHVLFPRIVEYPDVKIGSDECEVDHYRGILNHHSGSGGVHGWTVDWFPIKVLADGPASLEAVKGSSNIQDHILATTIQRYLVDQISPQAYHMEVTAKHAQNMAAKERALDENLEQAQEKKNLAKKAKKAKKQK
ncbi:MAG: hypothetical protein WDW38_006690 [Sanguina aurantia]